ncbi:MAG: purine-nucleoside phosphorylase [Ignavibacteriales bacterium]|nr:purine-nucleoside phosphorylase [Ignavibacteriales bacterium]
MKNQQELTLDEKISQSIKVIKRSTKLKPKIGIILGSGLGDFADSLEMCDSIDAQAIPYYPHSSVMGHKGRMIFGKIGKIQVLAFQGRVHFYETGNLETILYPIRVAHALGIEKLILTNAAGGVNKEFTPGDLMLIVDQINLTFENPLAGNVVPLRNQPLYDTEFQNIIKKVAEKNNIKIQTGVYCGLKGPSYETASEVKMIRQLGADAVGMSTVNEASLAFHLGMRIAGFSCITNLSTGILDQKLSHVEVTEVANKVKHTFSKLVTEVILAIGN